MRLSIACLSLAGLLLAACSAEHEGDEGQPMDHTGHHMVEVSEKEALEKKESAALLVERFGVEACKDVDLIGILRRTNAEGDQAILRSFTGSVKCVEGTRAALTQIEFTEDTPGNFSGNGPDGAAEKVKVVLADDGTSGLVEWEVDRR